MERRLLFISYASEDGTFVRWLATRLTSLGYYVWYDRYQLGGEQTFMDAEAAIKEHTFRQLAVMSTHSVNKRIDPRFLDNYTQIGRTLAPLLSYALWNSSGVM